MSKRIVYALPMPRGDEGAAAAAAVDARDAGPFRFEKELLREGVWVHPTKKFTFRVTPKRMRGWVEAFRRMQAAGLKVPVPFGHSDDPRDNAGFLEDLRLEGNRLVGVVAVERREDAEKIGTTVRDVSVGVNPDFVDAHQTRFGEVIEHVALTTRPLVEGQTNFSAVERLAAANGDEAEVWTFAAQEVKAFRRDPKGSAEEGDSTSNIEHSTANAEREEYQETEGTRPIADTATSNIEHRTPNIEPNQDGSRGGAAPETAEESDELLALRLDLARERSERILAEVAGHVSAGRLSPAAAGPAAALLAASGAVRYDLERRGEAAVDVAGAFRQVLGCLPAGAAMDPADRTRRLRPIPNPGNSQVAGGRATAQAARRMLESRGYAVTLSDDGTAVLEAEKGS